MRLLRAACVGFASRRRRRERHSHGPLLGRGCPVLPVGRHELEPAVSDLALGIVLWVAAAFAALLAWVAACHVARLHARRVAERAVRERLSRGVAYAEAMNLQLQEIRGLSEVEPDRRIAW